VLPLPRRERRILEFLVANRNVRVTKAQIFSRVYGLFNEEIEDLAQPDNALPPELRARLISIGIWSLRECDRLHLRETESFAGLVDVSRTLAEALA
jgi:flagellar biosynthesis regulator FlaF